MAQRPLGILILAFVMLSPMAGSAQEADSPQTLRAWLEREHRFLHRYLAVVQQATHDYSYGYRTPALLMPVTIDLFTGYVAWLHEGEQRFLYPALWNGMNEEQQQGIRLLQTEEEEEAGSIKSWQQQLLQYEAGKKKLTEVADTIDYLGRLINRHLVLQENRIFPVLDQLAPTEQTPVLKRLSAFEQERLGRSGRARYEQLLAYIEEEIKAVAGRVW